jgi:hypothetical protein
MFSITCSWTRERRDGDFYWELFCWSMRWKSGITFKEGKHGNMLHAYQGQTIRCVICLHRHKRTQNWNE